MNVQGFCHPAFAAVEEEYLTRYFQPASAIHTDAVAYQEDEPTLLRSGTLWNLGERIARL